MTLLYVSVAVLVLLVLGVTVYAKTGKPQINGLVWKDISKGTYRSLSLKNQAETVIKWYANDVEMDEKYPDSWRKPNINEKAMGHAVLIPADQHNKFFDEVQKLLDERGRDEKITVRAYLYPTSEGNPISKTPHVHTINLTYATGSPDGTREAGYYCTICDSRFLYTNVESTADEVKEMEEDNQRGIAAMIDLLDWTYGEGKYAPEVDKDEKKG